MLKGFPLVLLATLAGWLAACSKPDSTASEEPAPDEPLPAETSAPTEQVAEATARVVPAATPAPRRLAPDGTFFLLVKKSIETDSGIIGLRPGTRVTHQPDGKYAAEGQTFELQPGEITNDLDLAARIAGADARAQAAIRQALAQRAAPLPGTTIDSPPAPDSNTPPSGDAPLSPPAPLQRAGSSLGGTSALGGAHTRTAEGWLWQKDAAGNWEKVRQLR